MADQLAIDHKELARRAYWNRYGPVTGHKNFVGSPMPDFDNLPETQQRAWGQAIDLPVEDINALLQLKDSYDREAISDGYHTIGELYTHRHALFTTIGRIVAYAPKYHDRYKVWCSEKHADGSMFDGYFIAGVGIEPGHTMTYHLPLDWWFEWTAFAEQLATAPAWDGHTAQDTLRRLKDL